MIHRLILTSFGILTLATCQNPKVSQSTTEQESVKTETSVNSTEIKVLDVTTNQTSGEPKSKANGEPEMSVGLPPDKEAVETAKKEQQNSTVKNTAGIVYLKEGENKFFKEYEMNVTFKNGEHIAHKSLIDFKRMAKEKAVTANTIVFNNLVNTIEEFNENWEVPAGESWHSRFF